MNRKPPSVEPNLTPSLRGWYRQPTYHFHEIARVVPNPSRHYGEVQWVFSPPVHCLPSVSSYGILLSNLSEKSLYKEHLIKHTFLSERLLDPNEEST